MKQALAIARKELDAYFGSPMALIFVGVFLAITLFAFFWGTAFWSRGIADVRPLFQWMPLLMIFLIAALTMRQWSEEQQSGTLEMLLTMPVNLTQLVIGKFLAVVALVAVALLITLSLPITVALLGSLDLGPVIGGYLAAMLMAAAYAAIGLFISSRTDNQIVSLILTVIVCGLFYLVGSSTITSLTNSSIAEILRAIGTGSRFESIERGVIDLRDLVYYGSLTALFLVLNVVSLDSKRWSTGTRTLWYRRNKAILSVLIAVNLIVFNVLMYQVNTVRADLTQNGEYTLAPVTRDLMEGLQEPMLIRGYFSQKTHPLLAPLVPRIRDMLQEYEVAAKGKLTLEFVDPITNPELETEANQTYGIQPSPLQTSDRGGVAVINAYMDILIRYGDQSKVLNLLDLIEQVDVGGGQSEVRLRNLEYDLTSTIQRVVYGFQSLDAVLGSLSAPAKLTLYVTPNTLPEDLKEAPTRIKTVIDDIQKRANGKLEYATIDVSDPLAKVDTNALAEKYQIQPISSGFFSSDIFYLHMLLEVGNKFHVIFPTGTFSDAEIRSGIEAALKRVASGFLQVVGVWTPPAGQTDPFTGQQSQSLQQYNTIIQALGKNYEVRTIDLSSGEVAGDVNALVLIGPQNLTDIERFAIDQYLMRGGSIFVALGTYQITTDQQTGNVALAPISGGIQDMLTSYGITIEPKLVMDKQDASFALPVDNQYMLMDYPHLVDVRPDGMDKNSSIVSGLASVTMNWVSPITLDETLNKDRKVSVLLKSSSNSWTSTDTTTIPNLMLYPETGFAVGTELSPSTLAVAVEGRFTSFFKDKTSPFPTPTPAPTSVGPVVGTPTPNAATSSQQKNAIGTSPDTARLIVVGSSEFLNDAVFGLWQRLGEQRESGAIQFVENSVDYFVQDTALATIRTRGSAARLLRPLVEGEQSRWEAFNYLFALVSLAGLGMMWQAGRRSEKPMELVMPEQGAA